MQYAVGNVLYYWPKERIESFYDRAANSSAEIVYLGESVCAKRKELSWQDWLAIGEALASKGKQVVYSTLALLQNAAAVRRIVKAAAQNDLLIEANDLGVVNLLAEHRMPFVAGHAMNVYNAQTLRLLQRQGMVRWCMPVELSREWLIDLMAQCEALGIRGSFDVEVFGYGHLPLAYSARCFTARSENRPKDDCQTCCIDYPQGREVISQEGQSVFVLNGIQTQSGYCCNLGNDLDSMRGLVDIVRLSPQEEDTLALIERFKANEHGQSPLNLSAAMACNGYWRRMAGLELVN